MFLHAQADLRLRWAHMPFCWFCHVATHLCTHLLSVSSLKIKELFSDAPTYSSVGDLVLAVVISVGFLG